MDKVLIVNAGSSSLKFSLYEMLSRNEVASGSIERIGENASLFTFKQDGKKDKHDCIVRNHSEAVDKMMSGLIDNKAIDSINEIKGIGNRILHGKEKYTDSVIIDDSVIKDIEDYSDLGPLHHPSELAVINRLKIELAEVPMVAVFDTAFHQTMPKKNYLYSVPTEWYEKYGIRKYGFHGTSHKYITGVMKEKLGKDDVNLIVCHIGNGASISAIRNGECYDTTMGLTPLDGLMMGTRSGSIDPSILEYICKKTGKDIETITSYLNKNSGLMGIAGVNDFRDLESLIDQGDEKALLAYQMYCDRVAKSIISYMLELEGQIDGIVFTAGVGENVARLRQDVFNKISKVVNIKVDTDLNNKIAGFKDVNSGIISTSDSKMPVYVIPTDEESVILDDTVRLVNNKDKEKQLILK